MKFNVAVSGAVILSAHNGYKPFIGSIGVKESRIVWVTEKKIQPSECELWLEGTDRILMPGLVNGHCHGDMTLARVMGDDLTLMEQNRQFADSNWFYSIINDEDRYFSRQLTYCEALLSGTTFIMENMYWGLGERLAQAMSEVGIRGALAEDIRTDFVDSDRFIPDEKIDIFRRSCEEKGLIPVIGSISEENFTSDRLQYVKEKCARFGLLQTFHMAETAWRQDLVRERFGTTSVSFLRRNNILGPNVIGSHVVYTDDDEVRMLAESGTVVVNTPLCEMKIADGIANIPKMVQAGVTICLGTDGAMWNNSSDLFHEMKGMSLLHTVNSGIRTLNVTDILDMVTVNGTKAFGLEKDYGTIEEGKKADFILIRTDAPHMQPLRTGLCENVTSNIVFCATGNDVSDVFVDGRHVVENGALKTMSLSNILKKVQSASEKIACNIQSKQFELRRKNDSGRVSPYA